jgi:hypothetical protein
LCAALATGAAGGCIVFWHSKNLFRAAKIRKKTYPVACISLFFSTFAA